MGRSQLWAWIVGVVATCAFMAVLSHQGSPLKTFTTPRGILDFELASSASAHQFIAEQWSKIPIANGAELDAVARTNCYLDFGFILAYTLLFATSWIVLRRHWQGESTGLGASRSSLASLKAKFALAAIWAVVAAGMFDVVENVCLLSMLGAPGDNASETILVSEWVSTLCRWSAGIKFLIIGFVGIPGVFNAVRLAPDLGTLYSWTLRPLLECIARYPLLVALGGLIFWLTRQTNPFAPGLGVQYLFWNGARLELMAVGAALGVVAFELTLVSYLLLADSQWLQQADGDGSQRWRRQLQFSLLGFVLLILSVWRGCVPRPWDILGSAHPVFLTSASVVTFVALVIVFYFAKNRDWNRVVGSGMRERVAMYVAGARQAPLQPLHNAAAIFLALVAVALLVIQFLLPNTPALVVCALIASATAIYGRIHYLFPQRHFGWSALGFVVILMGTSGSHHHHRFVDFSTDDPATFSPWTHWLTGSPGDLYQLSRRQPLGQLPTAVEESDLPTTGEGRRASLDGGENDGNGDGSSDSRFEGGLVDDTQSLLNWCKRQPVQEDGRKRLVIVATAGGGIRAAYWTAVVLRRLELACEERHISFPQHTRLITGSSGGMLGAAHYVSSLPETSVDVAPEGLSAASSDDPSEPRHQTESARRRLDRVVEAAGVDGLGSATFGLLMRDIPSLGHFPLDRGERLQLAWEAPWKEAATRDASASPLGVHLTFADLCRGEREGWRPSLVFSPMMVDDGRQLFVSNLDLRALCTTALNDERESTHAVQLFEMFPGSQRRVRLSTAVRMTSSFPYITPVGVLPTTPARRLVDSGFFDDYGIVVATRWIRENASWLQSHRVDVALIEVTSSGFERSLEIGENGERKRVAGHPQEDRLAINPLVWLTTPAEAVLKARTSTMAFSQ